MHIVNLAAMHRTCVLSCLMLTAACGQTPVPPSRLASLNVATEIKPGKDIASRFAPPAGFTRTFVDTASFAYYLCHLPVKPVGAKVLFYNGEEKYTQGLHAAVVDISVGDKNLQQCADAVMRLRAEYLFTRKQYDDIHFNFVNGFRADYSKWAEGYRIRVNGNDANWYKATAPSYSRDAFMKYLEIVYSYAGTLSLAKELQPVSIDEMQIGDVFVQGGSPGHAVMVMDLAESETHEKVFMIAQSFMPAQSIHVLINPENEKLSPWYSTKSLTTLATPEWTFYTTDLKRFPSP